MAKDISSNRCRNESCVSRRYHRCCQVVDEIVYFCEKSLHLMNGGIVSR